MSVTVRIRETDQRFGVVKGELYEAIPYSLDPHCKITLLRRIPDGYEPKCNMYRHSVQLVTGKLPTSLEEDTM